MLDQHNSISGKEGTVYMTVGNQRKELATLKTFIANLELATGEVRRIGHRMPGTKVTGASGSGEMTFEYFDSTVRSILAEYVKNGTIPDISIQATNDDPTSEKGRQTYLFKGVVFTSAKLMELDGTTDDVLEDSTSFVFNDFEELERFRD